MEETLAGRAGRIKAYSVAISVLDRDDTFDPQTDPMVRIEAVQLRRRLERYYLTEGVNDPVIIDLPKGDYVPVFRAAAGLDLPANTDTQPSHDMTTRRISAAVLAAAFLAVAATALALIWIPAGKTRHAGLRRESESHHPGSPFRPSPPTTGAPPSPPVWLTK